MLHGPLGIGKSHLLHELCAQLRADDYLVTLVRATPASQSIPFGALSTFVAGGEDVDRLAMLRAAVEAIVALPGDRRHVIAVDDAPMLDQQSLAVLETLVTAHRVPVLTTVRSSDLDPAAIDSFLRSSGGEVIELGPLSKPEALQVAQHLTDMTGPDTTADQTQVDRAIDRAAGNPLFLRELLLAQTITGEVGLTAKLRNLVESRIGTLDAQTGQQLAMVAVCDPVDVTLDIVDQVVIAALERSGLVTTLEEGDGIVARPAHPIYGEVVRAGLGALERDMLVDQLSTALLQHEDRRRGDSLRLVNWILDNGGRPDAALAATASREALWWHDIDRARELANLAVTDDPNFDHLFAAGEIARLTGEVDEGMAWWSRASELADTDADIGKVAMAIAQVYAWFLGQPDDAVDVLEKAAARMADPIARLECLSEATLFASLLGRYDAVIETAEAVLYHPEAADQARWTALTNVVWADAQLLRLSKSEARFSLAAELREIVGPERAGEVDLCDAVEVSTRMQQGKFAQAIAHFRSVDEAHRPVGTTLFSTAQVHLVQGQVAEARKAAERSVVELAAYDPFNAAPLGAAVACIVRAASGEVDEARTLLATAQEQAVAEGVWETIWFQRAAAWIAQAEGDHDVALTHLVGSIEFAQRSGHDGWAQLGFVDLLAFAGPEIVAGEVSQLIDHARSVRPSQSGAPYCEALTDAVFALADRDLDALDRHGERLGELGARWAFGAALVASTLLVDDPVDACRRATVGCCMVDNRVLIPAPAIGLSDRERQVALSAGAGRSSASIAEELFLSVRTVNNHLQRAYRSLDISTRGELGELLAPALPTGHGTT